MPSHPPPSSNIPGKTSSPVPYLIGIVVLLSLALWLFVWKSKQSTPTLTTQSASITSQINTAPPPPLYAPPPPPKVDEEPDASADAGKQNGTGKGNGGGSGQSGCGKCTEGESSPALNTALRARAQSAQGCYNRALRTSEVSGSMTVSVQVGPSGSVCSASLVNDSVNSNEIATCVLGRFRGQSFPPPSGGCVTVNIPISFTIKQ